MEQLESQLSAPSIVLETAVLDRIDELVAPGTNVNAEDAGWSPQVPREAEAATAPLPLIGVSASAYRSARS